MALTTDDVREIAHLACLAIRDKDVETYTKDLSHILALVEQLKEVDTQGILPMAHPLDMVQRLRADKVSETDRHTDYQRIAPQVDAGLYLIPKVIE